MIAKPLPNWRWGLYVKRHVFKWYSGGRLPRMYDDFERLTDEEFDTADLAELMWQHMQTPPVVVFAPGERP